MAPIMAQKGTHLRISPKLQSGVSGLMEPVYADYNATTPLAESVKAVIVDSLELWGNPSSAHVFGETAKKTISKARNQVASMLKADPSEIILNSGGTEGNNHVIHSALESFQSRSPDQVAHVITTSIEHDAVRLPLLHLQSRGRCEVTWLRPDPLTGAVSADQVLEALRPTTSLVTVMLANNETGVLQPVSEMARRVRGKAPGVLIHTDAAQAIGKIPVDVTELGVDYLTVVGHKFYGPRIGALFVRRLGQAGGSPLHPLIHGGGQEGGHRAGTENTPMVAGLGEAAALVSIHLEEDERHMTQLRDALEQQLQDILGPNRAVVAFPSSPRLPNTSSVAFPSLRESGRELASACAKDFLASTGAACHAASFRASRVLVESGVEEALGSRTLRISLGRHSTLGDVHSIVTAIRKQLPNLEEAK